MALRMKGPAAERQREKQHDGIRQIRPRDHRPSRRFRLARGRRHRAARRKGCRMKIACLSYGERGESQFAWKKPGVTLEA